MGEGKNNSSAAVAAPLTAGQADPAALSVAELRAIYEKATPGPWAIESCGEKGDGSNMIGVAFHPNDQDCKHPLAGWLDEADERGEFIEYYRDEVVAECEHRNRNSGADATFIAAAYNNMRWLLDAADACAGMVGLVQLLLSRDDLTPELRAVLESNHRIVDARAALSKSGA